MRLLFVMVQISAYYVQTYIYDERSTIQCALTKSKYRTLKTFQLPHSVPAKSLLLLAATAREKPHGWKRFVIF